MPKYGIEDSYEWAKSPTGLAYLSSEFGLGGLFLLAGFQIKKHPDFSLSIGKKFVNLQT